MEWEIVSLVPRRECQMSKCKEDPWPLLKWMGLWEAVNERDGGSPLMALWLVEGWSGRWCRDYIERLARAVVGRIQGGHTQWTLN